MTGLAPMLGFLTDLEANNDLEWMRANKPDYLAAKQAFLDLVDELIDSIVVFDPAVAGLNAKDLIFRLNRDTRFGKDKSPYNPSFRAHISSAGRKPIPPGYYLQISPKRSFLGGGIFATQFPAATTMVRDFIVQNPNRWREVVEAEPFASIFTVEGECLKRPPRGYDRDNPLIEMLKHKSWCLEYDLIDEDTTEKSVPHMAQIFERMKPFNDLLAEATTGFTYPVR